jgi:uncharacterized protein (DUF1778 family)
MNSTHSTPASSSQDGRLSLRFTLHQASLIGRAASLLGVELARSRSEIIRCAIRAAHAACTHAQNTDVVLRDDTERRQHDIWLKPAPGRTEDPEAPTDQLIQVILSNEDRKRLDDLTTQFRYGNTAAQAIRRALSLYIQLLERSREGWRFGFLDSSGNLRDISVPGISQALAAGPSALDLVRQEWRSVSIDVPQDFWHNRQLVSLVRDAFEKRLRCRGFLASHEELLAFHLAVAEQMRTIKRNYYNVLQRSGDAKNEAAARSSLLEMDREDTIRAEQGKAAPTEMSIFVSFEDAALESPQIADLFGLSVSEVERILHVIASLMVHDKSKIQELYHDATSFEADS